jgi:hypothetical protein
LRTSLYRDTEVPLRYYFTYVIMSNYTHKLDFMFLLPVTRSIATVWVMF